MFSTMSRNAMFLRRSRSWVPLALLSALPLAAVGDEPATTEDTKRPTAARQAEAAKQPQTDRLLKTVVKPAQATPRTLEEGRDQLRPNKTQLPLIFTPLTEPQQRTLPAPQRENVRPRDLLYRGENAGPYHAIYLQGVPPGVRIQGVTPPPIIEPRIRLIAPKVAPRHKRINQGEIK